MSNLHILQSQQSAWRNVALIEDEPGSGNNSTLVLNNSSGSSVSLTGLEIVGQSKGATHDVLNRGIDPIQLLPNNTESQNAYQFADGATIQSDASVRIYYNGLRWEVLSVGGGGGGGGTPNMFPVYSSTGAPQDSQLQVVPASRLHWGGEKMSLWNPAFVNFEGNNAVIAIGDYDPQYTPNTFRDIGLELSPPDQPAFGGIQVPVGKYFIDVEPVVTINNGVDGIGIFSNITARATANSEITGLYGATSSYGNKLSGYNGNLKMTAVHGVCYVRSQNETEAVAGRFECYTGGNSTGTNTTPLYGIRAYASGGHNGVSPLAVGGDFYVSNVGGGGLGETTEAIALKAWMDVSPSVTRFDSMKGLALQGWIKGTGTVLTSYGIYIDTSIDVGVNAKWAIYSLSASPSLITGPVTFNGQVTGPLNPYGPTWNGSTRFATEDAVYDKIEALVLSSGVDTVSNQDVGGVKNFTSGINSTSYGAQPNVGGDGYAWRASASSGVGSGNGGYMELRAGAAIGSGNQGGYIDIIAGDGDYGNNVTLYGGAALGPAGRFGGNVILEAGRAASGLTADQGTIQFQEHVSSFTARTVTWDFRTNTANRTVTIPDRTGTMQVNTQAILKVTLTPNGALAPGLIVLENTTGVTPTISRVSTGQYDLTLTGKFLDDTKIQYNISWGINSSPDYSQGGRSTNDVFHIRTISTDAADYYDIDAITRLTLEIYP